MVISLLRMPVPPNYRLLLTPQTSCCDSITLCVIKLKPLRLIVLWLLGIPTQGLLMVNNLHCVGTPAEAMTATLLWHNNAYAFSVTMPSIGNGGAS